VKVYTCKAKRREKEREREERRWLVGEEEEGEGRRGSYGLFLPVLGWCDWHELRHMTLAREVKANARAALHGFWRPVKVEWHKLIQHRWE